MDMSRGIEIDELELEEAVEASPGEEDSVSIEGVELEEEMQFIKGHFCSDDGDLPLFLLVEDEYFELGLVKARFDQLLSLASVGAGYRIFLHLGGKKISLMEPGNLIRLIEF